MVDEMAFPVTLPNDLNASCTEFHPSSSRCVNAASKVSEPSLSLTLIWAWVYFGNCVNSFKHSGVDCTHLAPNVMVSATKVVLTSATVTTALSAVFPVLMRFFKVDANDGALFTVVMIVLSLV